jgi:hypothetical protein
MQPKPLTSCPHCDSRLLLPLQTFCRADATTVVSRRCPECAHCDLVVAQADAVDAWLARQERIRARLAEYADLLALEPLTLYA